MTLEGVQAMDFIGDIIAAPFVCMGWIIVGAIVGSIVAGLIGLGPDENSSGLGLVQANLIIATVERCC